MNFLRINTFFLLLAAGCLWFSCSKAGLPNSAPDLKKISRKENTVIIDVRTVEEYESGHVNHSVNIPLQVLPDSIENLKKYDNIIVVCRSGNRSLKAKALLEENGLKNIYNGGGWEDLKKRIK